MCVCVCVCVCVVDTAAKLQVTKVKAGEANDTAIDVLERLKDLNLGLLGLQRNYSQLQDHVNTANNMIQDPEKNSKQALTDYGSRRLALLHFTVASRDT